MNDVRAVAYHEAGHAVVAWVVGLSLRKVTIRPDPDALGRIVPHGDLPFGFDEWRELGVRFVVLAGHGLMVTKGDGKARRPTEFELECARLDGQLHGVDEYERMLMVCTAGEVAQHISTQTVPSRTQRGWDIGDRAAAYSIWAGRSVAGVTHNEMVATWSNWKRRTRSLLKQPFVWQRVEALAAALLQQQTLTGRQIRRVLRDERITG